MFDSSQQWDQIKILISLFYDDSKLKGWWDPNKHIPWHDTTHRTTVFPEVYPQLPHRSDDRHQALDCVAEHHRLILQALLLTVARLMDNLHLFDNCTLPRLSRAQQQQLYLPAGLLPVHGQLPVDLPRPLRRLLLETGHRAPHPVTELDPCTSSSAGNSARSSPNFYFTTSPLPSFLSFTQTNSTTFPASLRKSFPIWKEPDLQPLTRVRV